MAAIIVVILGVVMVVFTIKHLFYGGSRFNHSTSVEQQNKAKMQKKKNKPVKKHNGRNITSKANTKKSSVVSDTAAVLAGAALAHQLRKHHKHDDFSDIDDSRSDTWDDEFDDLNGDDFYDALDYQNYEDSDDEYERAAYEEERAAYDDFIASMDMDND